MKSAALVDPEVGLEMLRRWVENQEGLLLMLATMPEGSTPADALRRHRKLRQLGRRPSACMDALNDEEAP